MANVLLIVVLVAIVVGLVILIRRFRRSPERKLLRDFRTLRKMILAGMDKPGRGSAKILLEACEAHLQRLVNAKEQQHMLAEMAKTTRELTGRDTSTGTQRAVDAFDRRVADNLANFFTSLTRISSVVALQEEDALASLKDFADDLDLQRSELVRLTLDLQGDPRGAPTDFDPKLGDELSSQRAAEVSHKRGD